ncbi:MAG: glycosyltransferase [Patescibacteria group bacterium]|nr:glycosyltransferase [Patescibacteria group bacterium]
MTHNNEQTIKDSVTSIKDIINELIVIDDFSTDKTTDAIKSIYPTARIFNF